MRAGQKGLEFSCRLDPGLPGGVRGDERRLRQVLLNLLSNAVKFTGEGSVRLAVERDPAGDARVRFRIEDTGTGIPESAREKIFQPFEQLTEPGAVVEGTGLGLAITRELVELMGGELELESEPGRGSTFSVAVPLAAVTGWEPSGEGAEHASTGYLGRRRRVLVADDRSENRVLLGNMLQPLGFEVIEAAGGAECLARLAESRIDLLLVDLVMPGVDGFEVTRRVRASAEWRHLPVIAVSASVYERHQQLSEEAGCSDFLAKPVDERLLWKHLGLEWTCEVAEKEEMAAGRGGEGSSRGGGGRAPRSGPPGRHRHRARRSRPGRRPERRVRGIRRKGRGDAPQLRPQEDRRDARFNNLEPGPGLMTTTGSPGFGATVLVVDDTPANLEVLVSALSNADFGVLVATNGSEALERARQAEVDLILLDVMMPGIDGFETCARLKQDARTRDIPVIFMTALSDTADKVRGFAAGAVDYVTKPIRHEEVLARVETHLALRRLQRELEEGNRRLSAEVEERRKAQDALRELNESLEQRVAERTAELETALAEVERLRSRLEVENQYLQEEIGLAHDFQGIISHSESFRRVLSEVEQVADTGATVLILGETGTGKELLARAVHDISRRRERPLVKVNCAALAENLIESELFGHERGAFTGAAARKTGRFELADGGTLFLGEVGELPLDLQAKMLRVLQEGEFERLGGTETLRVDVRVIAATNRDLQRDVGEGRFRQDLFYRLNVFPIRSLPLRERREDIPLLVRHFVGKFSGETGR